MRRITTWLRRIASRCSDDRSMQHVIEPLLADLEFECEDAQGHGYVWRRRWMVLAGVVNFCKVVAMMLGQRAYGVIGADSALTRPIVLSTAVAGFVTLVFAAVPFRRISSHPDAVTLAMLLVAQALPLSMPIGLLFGVLLGFRAPTPRVRRALIGCAVVLSALCFVLLAWIVPASNQVFRETAAGRPLQKTISELSLIELAARLESTVAVAPPRIGRSLWIHYHTRWALAFAPLAMMLFALAFHRRGHRRTSALGLIATSAVVLYFSVLSSARAAALDGALPAFAAAWAPNIILLLASAVVVTFTSSGAATPVHAGE